MSTKRKTKIMVAGGLGSLMLALALLLMVVLPATQLGSVATEAQPQIPGPPGMGGPGMGSSGRGPPEMGSMRRGMPGQMGMTGMGTGMGTGMQAAPAPIENIFEGDPFESSRPNPFSAGLDIAVEVGTKYGPDWGQLPLASRLEIGSAQRRPEPEPVAAPELAEVKFMRISSIMWTGGRPLAIYEMRAGETGTVQPGDIVDDWLVEQIGQDYVRVRNVVSGEIRRALLERK